MGPQHTYSVKRRRLISWLAPGRHTRVKSVRITIVSPCEAGMPSYLILPIYLENHMIYLHTHSHRFLQLTFTGASMSLTRLESN